MSKSNLNIRFYLRTNHVNKDGTCAIMVRITANGERTVFSTKLSADPNSWDADTNSVKGKSKADKELNRTLEDMKSAIRSHYYELERYDALVTAEKVRNSFHGITARTESLMQLFREYMDEYASLAGIGKSKATVQKYVRCYRRVQEFLKAKYSLSDIPLVEIGHKFITDLECYLRTVSQCNENTTAKFIMLPQKRTGLERKIVTKKRYADMGNNSRKQHGPEFKAKVALEALKEQATLPELEKKFGVSQYTISRWKNELLRNASQTFGATNDEEAHQKEVDNLHRKIGELEMMLDFAKRASRKLGVRLPEDL